MSKRRPATSKDVAERAGVSRATVSVVLNGARSNVRVSDETRDRILAAAAELDYFPHPTAQALRRQQSGVIGFVPEPQRAWKMPYDSPVPYLLGKHIAHAASERGYHVVEAGAGPGASRDNDEMARFLMSRRIDGVIFHAPESDGEVRRFVDRGVPVVQLMRPREAVPTATITVDPQRGISAAIDHLVDLGHRRIALLGSRSSHPNDRARLDAFLAALDRHGISIGEEYLRLAHHYRVADGIELTHALLALPRRPTAIFAAGDSLALGALHALYQAHVRVPDAMSLISYDDTFVALFYPPLTSVAQPLDEVAARATSTIVEQIAQPPAPAGDPGHVVLPSHLVVRDSTCPPPDGDDWPT